jgi:hypothetical protein
MEMLLLKYGATIGIDPHNGQWVASVPASVPGVGLAVITATSESPSQAVRDLDAAIMASEEISDEELAAEAEAALMDAEQAAGIQHKEEKLEQMEQVAGEIVNVEERAHFLFNRATAINHAISTIDHTIRSVREIQNQNTELPAFFTTLTVVVVQKKKELAFLANRLRAEMVSHRNTQVLELTEAELRNGDLRLIGVKAVAVVHSSLVKAKMYQSIINTNFTERMLNVDDLYYEVNVKRIDDLCGTNLVDENDGGDTN